MVAGDYWVPSNLHGPKRHAAGPWIRTIAIAGDFDGPVRELIVLLTLIERIGPNSGLGAAVALRRGGPVRGRGQLRRQRVDGVIVQSPETADHSSVLPGQSDAIHGFSRFTRKDRMGGSPMSTSVSLIRSA